MNRRRLLALLGASVLTAGGLTACSSTASGGTPTITLLEYQQPRADAAAKLLPSFEKAMAAKGTPVKVKLVRDILTDDQLKTKLTQEYIAGTAPDVVDQGNANVVGYAGAGYLLPIKKYLDGWDQWKDWFPNAKQQVVQQDGEIYALPHEASVQSLFYRKDVLQRLGISTAQPQTWTDLISRLKAITAKTGDPSIVLPAGTAWGGGSWGEGFSNVVNGAGSGLYDPKTQKWTVKDSAITATFDLYQQLQDAKLLPTQALLNPNPWIPTKYKAFVAGTLPVAAQGTWGWRFDWGPDGSAPIADLTQKVATWDYPALVAGEKPYSTSGVNFSYTITAKTQHADQAVALAEWMSSGKAMAEQLVASGAAAPRTGISDIEPYASQPTLLDAQQKLSTAIYRPTGDGSDQIAQAIGQATESILTGKADGSQAAAQFAQAATKLLGPSRVQG